MLPATEGSITVLVLFDMMKTYINSRMKSSNLNLYLSLSIHTELCEHTGKEIECIERYLLLLLSTQDTSGIGWIHYTVNGN